MHRAKRIQLHKALALLLSLSLILTAVFGGTFAQIITRTPSFINTFLSGLDPTGDLVIRKEVTHPFGSGYTLPEGLSFDFTVSLGADYAGKTVETSQGDKIADEKGNITVSAAPGSAVRIKDLMDGTPVTVTESPNGAFTPEGGAEQSITIQSGDNTITYTNIYAPGPVDPVDVTVTGTKLLEGRDWQEGDSFTFQLEYKLAGNDTWQNAGTASVSYDPANADFNKFSFTELVQGITYSSAGEYSFRVSEVEGTVGGITYDKVVSYFDVTVGDADMNGSLEIQNVTGYQNAVASYDASTGNYHVDVTVNNKYAPAGTATATIVIDKRVMSMSGEEKSAAGYTFELYDESGNLVATSGETSSAGETSIELTYDTKDAETTFHYTLKETHGGETHNGMIYADTVYPISVSIVDNLDGTISAYVYSSNEYQTELIEVEPEETEPEETEPEETEPEETEPEETEPEQTEPEQTEPEQTEPEQTEPEQTEPEQTEPVQTEPVQTEPVQTEPAQTEPVQAQPQETEAAETTPATTSELVVEIVTEPVPLSSGLDATEATEETQARSLASAPPENTDAPTEGNEDPTDPPATTPSVTNETDTPVVTSTQPETKEVAVIPEGAGSSYTVSFVNVYDPTDTAASFGGTKELTGRDLNEGEFTFALYATGDGFTITDGMEPKQTVSNDAEGNFNFASISYSMVGTYRYVVKEDASSNLGGVTYDESVFHVIVTVTDENGVLKATTTITDELGAAVDIKFQNSYKAAATSVTFTGTKILTGADLTADMFQFHLYKADANYNAQGAALAGASNDDSGSFTFESITCSVPGTFYYVVTEDDSAGVKGMTYDDTEYGIRVNVWDDGSGMLKASYAISVVGGSEVNAILFENSYTKPVDPPKPTDPTDPSDPSDPTDPSDPSDPTDPTDPPETTDPTKPSTPVDPDVPPTGDEKPVGLYIALVAISIVAIILLLVTGKKPKGRYLRK